jgi:prefoldin subunit 5
MSFLSAFRKRKSVDISGYEMTPKTLDSALELIANQDAQIQGLEKTISEQETRIGQLNSDLDTCLTSFGIAKKLDENKTVSWSSSHLQAADEAIVALNTERDELKKKLVTAENRIAELEKEQKSVSAKAREFLAAQGGKPLPVSSNGPKSTNQLALTEALDEANRTGNKDEVKRLYGELQKLKN